MIARRSFLAGILAAGVAPAAVGSQVLMPVRKIITPLWFGMDWGGGDDMTGYSLVVHPELLRLYPVEIGQIERFRFIVSDKLPPT